MRKPMKQILDVEDPDAAVPIAGNTKYVSAGNTGNVEKSAPFEIEHTLAGRNPQSSFVIEPQGPRSSNKSAVCDLGCGPPGAELRFLRRAIFTQRASAAIKTKAAVAPTTQAIRRTDPNASIRSSLNQGSIRIWKPLVSCNGGDGVFTKAVEPIRCGGPNSAFPIFDDSLYNITGEAVG